MWGWIPDTTSIQLLETKIVWQSKQSAACQSDYKKNGSVGGRYVFLLIAVLVSNIPDSYAQFERITDPEILGNGDQLFQENCAICHGKKAQGLVENWQVSGEDGKFPPPPLNGTAHTWHHPLNGLAHTIRNGTLEIGGSMPGWKDKLSDDDIFAIVIWISSLWPDEIYNAWMQRNVK